jgi:prepilin-type N-terminal cleavage/methylation domain-containing protein
MKKNRKILKSRQGFSLAEVLAAMMIGSMVLISVLTVYNRAEHAAASVTKTLSQSRNPYEALQLIAEDLDKTTGNEGDTNFVIVNRYINDYAAAMLAIQVRYKDPTDKQQQYETILWQCNSNYKGDANDMVLYRSCEGIVPEDKLLDKSKDKAERSAYVPICRGVTYFNMKIYTGKDKPADVFPGGTPLGIIITISFAKPFKNSDGHYEVPDNEKYTRTIAINKSRKIKFDVTENEEAAGETVQAGDSNNAADTTKAPPVSTSNTTATGTKKAAPMDAINNKGTRANRTGTAGR